MAERGLVPEPLERWGIRRLLAQRLRAEQHSDPAAAVATLSTGSIALVPEQANAQHYELPPAFFELVLGKHLKYSGAYWPDGITTLDAAEVAMFELVAARAQLADGQRILELGCGWGSLSLWMSQRYPHARIVAVSNSAPQRRFIETRRPVNLEVRTADMNEFRIDQRFDRVVSIEMFEHMHNWKELLHRIGGWLEPGGKLFVHVFCHRVFTYPFAVAGPDNWLGRYFFTGGVMPSFDLLPRIPSELVLEKQWDVDGTHYARTAEAWRDRLVARREAVVPVLAGVYGAAAPLWFQRWRLFFLACAELFAYRAGKEWLVGHYRLRRP